MANKKTILIIEDDKMTLKLYTEMLETEGFAVLEARDGKNGIALALEKQPDLILLDLMLPDMGGTQILKKIREDNWGKDVPVMILTNVADASKTAEAMKFGVHDYLVKSDWKMGDLVAKINEKLA
jgi:two-component system response regulator RpaA